MNNLIHCPVAIRVLFRRAAESSFDPPQPVAQAGAFRPVCALRLVSNTAALLKRRIADCPAAAAWAGRFMLLASLAALPLAAADAPPRIGVAVRIEARSFVADLQDARPACESRAAATLAHLCAERFPYLRWEPATNAVAGTYAGVLEVVLVGTSHGYGDEITLAFNRVVGAQTNRLTALPARVLYHAYDVDQPTQKPDVLVRDLERALKDTLDSDANRKILQQHFLAGVPIARDLDILATAHRFLVPVAWGDLLPGEGSLLEAIFLAHPPQGVPPGEVASPELPVRIKLKPEEPWDTRIGCSVREFRYPPTELRMADGAVAPLWDPLMPVCLEKRRPGTVTVFMREYARDWLHGTTSGLADHP